MDVTQRLRANPYLGALAPADLEALAGACVVTHYPKGATVFVEGERPHGVYFLVDGEVEVTRVARGRVHRINMLRSGALFGVMALIQSMPRSASCAAVQPSEIAMIPKEAVNLLLNQSAPVAYAFQRALAAQMARDLRESDRRLRDLLVLAMK